jgi:hypothetical protein
VSEDGHEHEPAETGHDTTTMTRHTQTTPDRLSRRTVLAGLGAAGLGTAVGASLGTTAFFSDRTAVSAVGRAGDLDLKLDYRATFAPHQDGAERVARLVDSGAARAIPGSDAVLVGELPALSSDASGIVAGDGGTALSGPAWTAFTTEYDACENPEGLPYVDGTPRFAFDIDGVRPHDAGEVTLSVHVCGNPAYLWLRAVDLADEENGLVDGETDLPDREGEGELDDYTWVRLWYDTDCSNTFDDREVRLYQGSLAGLRTLLADGYALDPVRDADRDGGRGDGHLPDGCVAVPGNPKCVDYGLAQAIKIESEALATGDYLTDDGIVSVTITDTRDGEPTELSVSADFEFQGIIVKGGNAAAVCGSPDGETRADDLAAPRNPQGRPTGISHLSVCVAAAPPDVRGICFDPGVHCLALEWYLPAFESGDDARPGFADLRSDAVVPDLDGDGAVTLADELTSKGLAVEPFRAIDTVQGDSVAVRFDLAAVQCRHNTTNPNPFAAVEGR